MPWGHMRGWLCAAGAAGALLFLTPRTASAAPGSFVYVPATSCSVPSAAAPPQICTGTPLVYAPTSAALVTTIPLASGHSAGSGGLAISPDGSRVYVSVSAGSSFYVTAVDATRHQVLGSVGTAPGGALAGSN